MQRESYPLEHDEIQQRFYFDSIGPKGHIRKVVEFRLFDEPTELWNFGFGDVRDDNSWNDASISNNHDLIIVMATVIQAALLFTEKRPKARLVIRPVDRRRNLLYHAVFARNWEQIKDKFSVLGVTENGPKPFDPKARYLAFIVFRKAITFDKK